MAQNMNSQSRDYTPFLLAVSIGLHLSFVVITVYLIGRRAWALAYVVAYFVLFLYVNVWFACAGCPKYGRTRVMIPFGGRLAAAFFRPRPKPPSRVDKAASLLLTLALTTASLVLSGLQGKWVIFAIALALNLAQMALLKATVARVFDGWGKF